MTVWHDTHADDPQGAAGRSLDAHHPARRLPRALVAVCAECRFSTHDSLDRPLRHMPTLDELRRVEAWLREHRHPAPGRTTDSPAGIRLVPLGDAPLNIPRQGEHS